MSGKQTTQSGTQPANERRSEIRHAGQAEQQTWKGGGREPIDPDDIGSDGEYLEKDKLKRPLRSDDN